MKTYTVFHHQRLQEYTAVKNGFSWAGFIFGLFWAIYNQLWNITLYLIVFIVGVSFLDEFLLSPNGLSIIADILTFGVWVLIGMYGNVLKQANLIQSGYDFIGDVVANNGSDAISKVGQ